MSSHYFVKEDQEPALLILDTTGSFEIIQELLEWSPSIIVSDQSLTEVIKWGIKIDVAVVSGSKTEEATSLLRDQAPVKVLSCNEDDLLSASFYFLIAAKYKAVNVIGCMPARVTEFADKIEIASFYSGFKWSYIRSLKFEKWMRQKSQLTLYPDSQTDEFVMEGIDPLSLKALTDGIVCIKSEFPFWVGEQLD